MNLSFLSKKEMFYCHECEILANFVATNQIVQLPTPTVENIATLELLIYNVNC